MRALTALLALLALMGSAEAHQEQRLWQALEQLQTRVSELEARLASESAAKEQEAAGVVELSYWLGAQDPFTNPATPPMRSGRFTLGETLAFTPAHFGQTAEGLFDSYSDTTRYPLAALSLEATLRMAKAGSYQLVVHATPPREVGGAGNVELALRLFLDDEPVRELPPSSTLAPRTLALQLGRGDHRLRLEVSARSPGFGPSPTRTRLQLGLQHAGQVVPIPLGTFLYPPMPE